LEGGGVSVEQKTRAVASYGKVRTLIANALPLIGLGVALIMNAVWLCLLGYFVLKLV
jgi:hypothetical protein